jgi:hypothetical protein
MPTITGVMYAVCTRFCCHHFPAAVKSTLFAGVQIPRGIRKLKSLHTMGLVNFAWGKEIIEEIKKAQPITQISSCWHQHGKRSRILLSCC